MNRADHYWLAMVVAMLTVFSLTVAGMQMQVNGAHETADTYRDLYHTEQDYMNVCSQSLATLRTMIRVDSAYRYRFPFYDQQGGNDG